MQSVWQGRETLNQTNCHQFELPEELIATHPPPQRGESRLLVVDRASGTMTDHHFSELPRQLRRHDLLVVNNSKVQACRVTLHDNRGREVEALLLPSPDTGAAAKESVGSDDHASSALPVSTWAVLAKRLHAQQRLFLGQIPVLVGAALGDGLRLLQVAASKAQVEEYFARQGSMPLPPYILKRRQHKEWQGDRDRYQTIFANRLGSVAAPTAGLHFSEAVLSDLSEVGVKTAELTLHIGRATFAPIRCKDYRQHQMGQEWYQLPTSLVAELAACRHQGGRVVAVGTTVVRALESARRYQRLAGWTDLFLYPGNPPGSVDALLTNFHLPGSSLLLLVMAFAGEALVREVYQHAIAKRYRFYSYGDAMLIV